MLHGNVKWYALNKVFFCQQTFVQQCCVQQYQMMFDPFQGGLKYQIHNDKEIMTVEVGEEQESICILKPEGDNLRDNFTGFKLTELATLLYVEEFCQLSGYF